MNIENITETQIEQLASTWALKVNRPITPYKSFLRDTKKGRREADLLPYFIVKHLVEMGYVV
tara:strand:+ start:382 stop:567 length:186 start_codon:yes stop_codon:yes gene_type:complete